MSDERMREQAIYQAVKVHAAARGIDLTDSIIQQALGPDEFRWMRSAIEAFEEAQREDDNGHPKVPAIPRYHHAAPAPVLTRHSPESNRGPHGGYDSACS